jgi:tetratricopeptide (TPR) repeat protein
MLAHLSWFLLWPLLLLTTPGCQKSTPPGEILLPDDPMELYRLGSEALKRNELNRAVEYLQSAVRHQPDFQEAQVRLGRAAYAADNLGVAVRAFADSLLLSPVLPAPDYSDADIHYNLAIVYAQSQQPSLALEQFRKASAAEPEFAQAWLRTAEILLAQGDKTEALNCLDRALRADPGLAEAHLARGQIEEDGGDLVAAQSSLARATVYGPALAGAHRELGRVLLRRGLAAEALGPLDICLKLAPQDSAAWKLRSEALEKLGLSRLSAQASAHAQAQASS